jgi:glutamate/tyrosine decarboxylase-like PLP-dependent enzyme
MIEIPASNAALFPAPDDRISLDDRLTRVLVGARERVSSGNVTPTLDLPAFQKELAQFDFQTPEPLEDILDWTAGQLERGLVQITHPRYFGLFNPNPVYPAQAADRIAGEFNPQLASSKTSPAAVAIENHVIGLLARRAGYPPEAAGHFTSGGSEANFTALVCALTKANPQFADDGVRAFKGRPAIYVSGESHLAWIKIAHETGIGRAAVRLVATDGFGRMDMEALERVMDKDRSKGWVPVMAVATAGTTGAGMIDNLSECAGISEIQGVWYHVDAAWGGGLIVSDGRRTILAGLERADSITIDAHKWLAVTMGCGMFLTRHAPILSAAFDVSTSYMPSHIPSLDPYVTSVQWSRRFLGLRLFLSLAAAGWSGYADHIERSLALASFMRSLLESRGWRIVNRSPLAVLCILPPPGAAVVENIVERVVASGRAWVSVAAYEGQKVIRACITNGETSKEDVEELVGALEAASACYTPNMALSV